MKIRISIFNSNGIKSTKEIEDSFENIVLRVEEFQLENKEILSSDKPISVFLDDYDIEFEVTLENEISVWKLSNLNGVDIFKQILKDKKLNLAELQTTFYPEDNSYIFAISVPIHSISPVETYDKLGSILEAKMKESLLYDEINVDLFLEESDGKNLLCYTAIDFA